MAIAGLVQSIHDFIYGSEQRYNPLENPNHKIDGRTIAQLMGASVSGDIKISPDTALTFASVYRSNRLLCDIMAYIPIDVIEENASGRKSITKEHDASFLLSREPSDILTSFGWRESSQANLNFHGNTFSRIIRNPVNAKPLSIKFYESWNAKPKYSNDRIVYDLTEKDGSETKGVPAEDVIHVPGFGFDGLLGMPTLKIAEENIKSALYAQKYAVKFLKNDATPPGILINKTANKKTREEAKEAWQESQSGDEKGKITVMPGDWDYKQIAIPPDQAQFLQTRQFSVIEIARWFGVPPHLLFELDRATNNNIEHQGIEFLLYTINGWVSRWEAELNRKMFTKAERRAGRFCVKFNTNALLRLDAKSRMQFYRGMWAVSGMTTNEIREKEDMNPIEGGDQGFVQQGFMPIDKVEDYAPHNQPQPQQPKEENESED